MNVPFVTLTLENIRGVEIRHVVLVHVELEGGNIEVHVAALKGHVIFDAQAANDDLLVLGGFLQGFANELIAPLLLETTL